MTVKSTFTKNFNALLFLIIPILLHQYNLETTNNKEQQSLSLETITLLDKDGVYHVPNTIKQNYLIISMSGAGQMEIIIENSQGNNIIAHELTLENIDITYLVPINLKVIDNIENGKIILKINGKLITTAGVYVELFLSDFLKLNFNDFNQYRFVSKFFDQINIEFYIKEDFDESNHYTIYFLINGFSTDLDQREKFKFYLNQEKNSFPTKDQHDLQSNVGYYFTLEKSITPIDSFYCIKKTCKYRMMIDAEQIDFFILESIITQTREDFYLNDQLKIVINLNDEINKTYIHLPNFNNQRGLGMNIINNEDITIDFGIGNDKNDQNPILKKELKGARNSIILTKQDVKFYKLSNKTIQLDFKLKEGLTEGLLILIIYNIQDRYFLNFPNYDKIYQNLLGDEIFNFYLIYQSTIHKETFSEKFLINSNEGQGQVFIKECDYRQLLSECTITKQDILNQEQWKENNQSKKIRLKSVTLNKGQNKELDLNFNCVDFRSPDKNFSNSYPYSQSCIFAIGIYNPEQISTKTNDINIFKRSNDKIDIDLTRKKNYKIMGVRSDELNFKTELTFNESLNLKNLFIKLVVLRGKGKLKISQPQIPQETKDNNDNTWDLELDFDNLNKNVIQSQTFEKSILLWFDPNKNGQIYFDFSFSEFSMLEMYLDLQQTITNNPQEELTINQIKEGQITEDNNYSIEQQDFYYKEYYLILQGQQEDLELSLNTEIQGLRLCVQKNNDNFDYKQVCDSGYSEIEILKISKNNYTEQDKISIAVIYKAPNKEFLNQLPISFKIIIKNQQEELNLLIPGHFYGMVASKENSLNVQISLTEMKKNSFLMMKSSFSQISISIYPLKTPEIKIAELNQQNFGLFIGNVKDFKKLYCNNPNCDLILKIRNKGQQNGQLYFGYTYDHIAMKFKEGQTLDIPSVCQFNIIIQTNKKHPLYFSYNSIFTKQNIGSKVIEQDLFPNLNIDDLLNGTNNFDYKIQEQNQGQITYTTKEFEIYTNPNVLFVITPDKVNHELMIDPFNVLNSKNKVIIQLHTTLQKIEPFILYKNQIEKNDFAYFYLTNYNNQKFSLLLNVLSGQAGIFINQGINNYPTINNYWKKNTDLKGGDLIIEPNSDYDQYGYTVGIYAQDFSNITLLYAPNFEEVIEVNYQELLNITIGDKIYFFKVDITNEDLVMIMGSKDTQLQVDIIKFDSSKNILENILEDKNLQESITLQNEDLVKEIDLKQKKYIGTYILKVKKINGFGKFIFALYDNKLPLIVNPDSTFFFSQKSNSKIIFQVKLKNYYEQVSIQGNRLLGDFQLTGGENLKELKEQEQNTNYKITADNPQITFQLDEKNEESIKTTKSVYIQAQTFEERSFYSILVKVNKLYQELTASQQNQFKVNKDISSYAYYYLTQQQKNQIQKLSFTLFLPNEYDDDPELLFFANQDVSLNKKTPFIPMPVISYKKEQVSIYKKLIIKTQIVSGYYFFKFDSFKMESKILIMVNLNDQQISYLNSYEETFNSDNKKLQKLFINEKGKLKISFQSKKDVLLSKGILTNKNQQQIDIQSTNIKNMKKIQNYDLINNKYDDIQYQVYEDEYIIDQTGLLLLEYGFDTSNKNQNFIYEEIFFKKENQLYPEEYLILEDQYIPINYDKNENMLIQFTVPSFIEQTFKDFKDQKLSTWINCYILPFKNEFINDFKKNGKSSLIPYKSFKKDLEFTLEDFQNGNNKQQQTLQLQKELLNKYGETIMIFVYFNYSFLKNELDLNMFTNSSTKGEIPLFILSNQQKFVTRKPLIMGTFIFIIIFCIIVGAIYFYCKKIQNDKKMRIQTNSSQSDNKTINEMLSVEKTNLEKSRETNVEIETEKSIEN